MEKKPIFKKWWFYLIIVLVIAAIITLVCLLNKNNSNSNNDMSLEESTSAPTVIDGGDLQGETDAPAQIETQTDKQDTPSEDDQGLVGTWKFDLSTYQSMCPNDPLDDELLEQCEDWFFTFNSNGTFKTNIHGKDEDGTYILNNDQSLSIKSNLTGSSTFTFDRVNSKEGAYNVWSIDSNELYMNHFCYTK